MNAAIWSLIATGLEGCAALLRAVTPWGGAGHTRGRPRVGRLAQGSLRALVGPLIALAAYSVGFAAGQADALHVADFYSLVVMPAPAVVIFGGLAWLIHRYAPPRR